MCKCTPSIRTPFCGKPGCERPGFLDQHRNPDGTYNGVSALSELADMTQAAVMDVWAQVKANSAKLNACPWHEFEPIPGTANPAGLRQKYRCKHCQGEVDSHAYHWHEQGRRPQL